MSFDFAQLMKADRRKQWKGLKEKHKEAIKKSKVDFDQKLGPALDKYQTQVEKLGAAAGKGALNTILVNPVFESSQALKPIVKAYQTSVTKLEEPAKKEMAGLLHAIEEDIKSWEELAVKSMGTPSKGLSDGEKKAAAGLVAILDNIRSMCLMIVTRGPRAVEAYKTQKPNPRLKAAELASAMVESARLAGSASHELANMAQQVVKTDSNYDMFKSRAKAAGALIQKALDAAKAFQDKWKINDDPAMTVSAEVDAKALKENWHQIEADFGAAVNQIGKLP